MIKQILLIEVLSCLKNTACGYRLNFMRCCFIFAAKVHTSIEKNQFT